MQWQYSIGIMLLRMLLILAFFSSSGLSQNILTGHVKDGSNDAAVSSATIFLSNTTKGTHSDEKGNFSLTNVPNGSYELVISCIGYETIKVNVNTNEKRFYRIILKPVSIQLSDFYVKGKKDKKSNYFNLFKDFFIGNSDNAKNCKIINPEIIYYADSADYFKAYARDFILIRNDGLGYLIKYALIDFKLHRKEHKVTYRGYPIFEELTASDERQQEQWSINRRKAYLGSLRHFMQSLYTCTLEKEGFYIQRIVEEVDKSGKNRPMFLHGVNVTIIPSPADTIVRTILPDTLRCSHLLKKSKGVSKILSFRGPVQVTYKHETESLQYQKMNHPLPDGYRKTPQVSIIYLNGNALEIEADGHLSDPTDLTLELYWGWELLSESLPYEYLPDSKSG